MSTHTPGPWTAIPRADLAENGNIIVESSNETICHVFDDENAPLIAKAPIALKLAEALRLALSVIPKDAMVYSEGDHGERVYPADVARAAIAEWDAQ